MAAARPAHERDLRLDGIRGLAVLLVLLYHVTTPGRLLQGANRPLPGGWVGVDVFFVLSGYLITRLLLAERRECGRIDRRAFYIRRLRRLGPALVVLLACWLLVTLTGLLPVHLLQQPGRLAPDLGAGLAIVPIVGAFSLGYNWLLAFHFPSPDGMGHLWTLSVEEQFYVVWPTVVICVFAARWRFPERVLWRVVALGLAGGVLLTVVSVGELTRDIVYFSSPTGGLGLLVGAAVALGPPGRRSRVLGVAALATILGCALFASDSRAGLLPAAVVATCAATAVLIACRGPWIDRVLTLSWLRYAGRRSYAIYLWSSPIAYATVVWGGRTWLMTVVVLVATFVIAEASWQLVERRFVAPRGARRQARLVPVRATP